MNYFLFLVLFSGACYLVHYLSDVLLERVIRGRYKIVRILLSAISILFLILFAISAFVVAVIALMIVLSLFMDYFLTGGIFGW